MVSFIARWNYYRRVVSAYVLRRQSQLTFWHEKPAVNTGMLNDELGPYYMRFTEKSDYAGPMEDGVPLLDYHGAIGSQYNPIAIAQYGLGNYNRYVADVDDSRRKRFLRIADWLVENLQDNDRGIPVWNHDFDWDYRETLRAPWYSGLAQGQGISVLVRAYADTDDDRYLEAAREAYRALETPVVDGGTLYVDAAGDPWIEEYIVDPPTHILNGFMWSLWGVYDLWLVERNDRQKSFFDRATRTIVANLKHYDTGYWSLYELSRQRLDMLASPFYHRLHIVQLMVMARLTGEGTFTTYATRWAGYAADPRKRRKAFRRKALFKVLHY